MRWKRKNLFLSSPVATPIKSCLINYESSMVNRFTQFSFLSVILRLFLSQTTHTCGWNQWNLFPIIQAWRSLQRFYFFWSFEHEEKKKGWSCMQGNDEANKRKKRISPLNYFHVKSLMINLIINFISSFSDVIFFGNMFGITLNHFYGLKLDMHQNWLR